MENHGTDSTFEQSTRGVGTVPPMSALTPAAMWALPRVGAPTVSDDWVVAPVTTYDPDANSTTTRLWRCDWSGSHLRAITAPGSSATRPIFSPGGRSLAFVRKVDGTPQLHVMPIAGGEPRQITRLEDGVIGAIWHPSGSRMIAVGNVPPEAGRQTSGVHATDQALYRYWDRWLTDEAYPHVFLIDVETAQADDLTPDGRRWMRWENTGDPLADVAISPDGSTVLFVADRSTPPHRDLRWSLFAIDLSTRTTTDLTPDIPGHASTPRFSSTGELIFGQQLVPDYYADPVQLTRLDLDTGEQTILDLGDWDRSPVEWSWSGDRLLLIAEDTGRSRLFEWAPSVGGAPVALTGDGSVTAFDHSGTSIAVNRSSLTEPPEIHRIDAGKAEPITSFTAEAMSRVEMPTVEELWVEGSEGDRVQVFFLSAGPGPSPLVQMVHGGPHGTFGDQWHWRWNAAVIAGDEYSLALVNFAGSTSFGDEFARSIHGAWGDRPARDVEAVTDHLVDNGRVDPQRMAIIGGSYGGYLVTWLATSTSRYRCVVAHAAVTDLPGMYASDITMGRARAYGAEAFEDLERVQRWSPLAHAGSIVTPTLVIHGDQDFRVPVGQGLSLYGLLQAKGVPARLLHFGDEGHWILDGRNSLVWYQEVGNWLEAHLG